MVMNMDQLSGKNPHQNHWKTHLFTRFNISNITILAVILFKTIDKSFSLGPILTKMPWSCDETPAPTISSDLHQLN